MTFTPCSVLSMNDLDQALTLVENVKPPLNYSLPIFLC